MELENRIIDQIYKDNDLTKIVGFDQKTLQKLNKKITYLSVDIVEEHKTGTEALKNLENYLYENIK